VKITTGHEPWTTDYEFEPIEANYSEEFTCRECGARVDGDFTEKHANWHAGERMRNFSGL
jgi:hypothetical protein